MKRIMIMSLLLPASALSGMQMPPKPSAAGMQPEKSYLEQLPGDLKKLIIASIMTKDIDAAAQNIKALAKTNKFFHDYINSGDMLKFIITTMVAQIPNIDELDAAQKLGDMSGMKNPELEAWLTKIKTEILNEHDLAVAAIRGDTTKVSYLLQEKVNVNSKVKKSNIIPLNITPLSLATIHNRKEVVQLLIDAGADLNALSGTPVQATALYFAARENAKKPLEILLNAGANPNTRNRSPLLMAVHTSNTEIVKLLLKAKADINIQGIDGLTPLIKAAINGDAEMLKILLKAGANPNLKSSKHGTALDLARKNKNVELEELLLKYGAQESQKEPQ